MLQLGSSTHVVIVMSATWVTVLLAMMKSNVIRAITTVAQFPVVSVKIISVVLAVHVVLVLPVTVWPPVLSAQMLMSVKTEVIIVIPIIKDIAQIKTVVLFVHVVLGILVTV